jgi:general secretion pathway protein G
MTRLLAASRARLRRGFRGLRGFTVVEILIVAVMLGVLAVLVAPRLSDATEPKRNASLRDDLRYLRTQIIVYRAQHRGMAPGYPGGQTSAAPTFEAFAAQLTRPTNPAGVVGPGNDPTFPLGPYLLRLPINAVNGSSAIRFVPADQPFPRTPAGPEGWVYQPSTGTLAANVAGADARGVDYFDY